MLITREDLICVCMTMIVFLTCVCKTRRNNRKWARWSSSDRLDIKIE